MNKTRVISALTVIFALAGCARTEPVHNINETVSSHYSDEQMKSAIIQAGLSRQWVMKAEAPGVIAGHLSQRGHTVDIRVTYSASRYSINYVSSSNLLAENGQIHRNYNRWVNNLDQDIKLRLASQPAN
ncbi:lipoprotein [Erwinia typographi]|uniref:Lipoprotein n=1 Tax=Erwinia typographi TaxID=371042 RepID=A0A0A3Z5W3_9GAMM|nr:hypothetical protein [Erwinia typographi]KGT94265.1 lipoprotein [Erwinia typographi]